MNITITYVRRECDADVSYGILKYRGDPVRGPVEYVSGQWDDMASATVVEFGCVRREFIGSVSPRTIFSFWHSLFSGELENALTSKGCLQ